VGGERERAHPARTGDPVAAPAPTREPAEAPTALDRGLGEELRRHRERAGLGRDAAADAGDLTAATVDLLEAGRVVVPQHALAALLTRYGVLDEERRAELLSLARHAGDPRWWQDFADILPQQYETYLRLEQATSLIRSYDPEIVPRLLQTRDYARASIRAIFDQLGTTHLGITRTEDVERQVDIRMRRQRLLDAPDGPTLWATVDEGALRHRIGGSDVLRAQLTHLLESADRPRVVLQVVLAGAARPYAANAPFTLMRFAQHFLPDIVYVEQTTRPLYLDRRADVDHYTMLMDRLAARAERPARTPAALSRIRSQL
jgi:uncharacterized protein DUF5753/helix-turn-helix protein